MELSAKQIQFNEAMERYRTLSRYQVFNNFVSMANLSLQGYLLYRVWPLSIGPSGQAISIVLAFLFADLINGLVHMMMDNNDRYDSIFGPFIANFHLHHKVMQYKRRNLVLVYCIESGSKVWLVGYLLTVLGLLQAAQLSPLAAHVLVYLGILSSLAEVSHYLCHSSDSSLTMLLGKVCLLLPKRHHARHHLEDNRNYAFLNGITDPVLNLLAAALYPGYKQTTDRHYAHYAVDNTDRR